MGTTRIERHGKNEVYVLDDAETGSSARVLPNFGFNCYSFRCRAAGREIELLRSQSDFGDAPAHGSRNGTPILFPFPNRIRGGSFQFQGQTFQLPRNERDVNAIHGLVIERPWRVAPIRPGEAAVTGRFQLSRDAAEVRDLWPADFIIELTYTLRGNRLTSRVRIENPDSRPLPWGFGTHPYFRIPLLSPADEQECSVVAPVSARWELQDLLPTGRRVPVDPNAGLNGTRPYSELKFDDVFTGLHFQGDWCTCRLIDRAAEVAIQFQFDRFFRELVVFTPRERDAICLEPYTCVTDAINLQQRGIDAGLGVLAPGGTVEGIMALQLERLGNT